METSLSAQNERGPDNERKGGIVLPLAFTTSAIRSFVDFDIVGHPYIDSIELQEVGSNQFAALVHHRGVVDLYVDPEAHLDEGWFHSDPAFINLRRRAFHITPIRVSSWQFTDGAIDIRADFALFDQTAVEVIVRQSGSNDHRITQFIPTPPWRDLHMLRFLHVEGFGILRAGKGTTAAINIGTNSYRPAINKLPLTGRRRYSVRLAQDARMFGLNRPGEFPIDDNTTTQSDGLGWTLSAIEQRAPQRFEAELSFDSRLNSTTLTNVTKMGVCWNETPDGVEVSFVDVTQNWLPPLSSPGMRAMATVRRWRRRRLSLAWSGVVKNSEHDHWVVDSDWRTNNSDADP